MLALLLLLTGLAFLSVIVSGMPRWAAWPLALLAVGYGGARFRREARRPAVALVFPAAGMPVRIDGEAVTDVRVQWRGPLAFVCWRGPGGRLRRLAWWPDTLPAAKRRELRLAAGSGEVSRGRRVMAP